MNDALAGMPPGLVDRLGTLLGDDGLEAWRQSLERPPAAVFRVNTLRAEPGAVIEELRSLGLDPRGLGWRPEVFVVADAERSRLTHSAAATAGRIFLQNPSSMLAVCLLDPRPGEEVLDLAAAPGGKTTYMAALMNNRGRIAAVESSKPRYFRLRDTCRRLGVDCVHCYRRDGRAVGRLVPERFSRVLLDAPCSGESLLQPGQSALREWGPKRSARLARLQRRLLESALASLKPGGTLVYATCTFAPEENEAVVDALLRRHPDSVGIDPLTPLPAASLPGVTRWRDRRFDSRLAGTRRILPQWPWAGFYLARLKKRDCKP